MGVVNFGSIPTARNAAMVTARRRAKTCNQCVAWRDTTLRPKDAVTVDIHTTLLTRRAVTAVSFLDLGHVYFSLGVNQSPEGSPYKNDGGTRRTFMG